MSYAKRSGKGQLQKGKVAKPAPVRWALNDMSAPPTRAVRRLMCRIEAGGSVYTQLCALDARGVDHDYVQALVVASDGAESIHKDVLLRIRETCYDDEDRERIDSILGI